MSRVLLVEEDALIRSTLSKALERYGHDVIAARSAYDAVSSMGRDKPDVILTEHRLEGAMNGSQLLEHASLVLPQCARVLMSSGSIPTETRRRGAHEVYLAKPFSIHVVAATLGDLDANRSSRAA